MEATPSGCLLSKRQSIKYHIHHKIRIVFHRSSLSLIISAHLLKLGAQFANLSSSCTTSNTILSISNDAGNMPLPANAGLNVAAINNNVWLKIDNAPCHKYGK